MLPAHYYYLLFIVVLYYIIVPSKNNNKINIFIKSVLLYVIIILPIKQIKVVTWYCQMCSRKASYITHNRCTKNFRWSQQGIPSHMQYYYYYYYYNAFAILCRKTSCTIFPHLHQEFQMESVGHPFTRACNIIIIITIIRHLPYYVGRLPAHFPPIHTK